MDPPGGGHVGRAAPGRADLHHRERKVASSPLGTRIGDHFAFDHRQEQEWAVESVPTLVFVIIFITVTI